MEPREISGTLRVRLAALAPDGAAILPGTVTALRTAWKGIGPLSIESVELGADRQALERAIRRWCDRDAADVVLTLGRSGHRQEDFVPEVTAPLLERTLPGIEERMYLASPRRPEDLLFRGRAGLRRGTIVINLPARVSRVRTIASFLAAVLPHAIEKARGSNRACGGGQT